jgi:hypothetical protein
VEISLNIQTEFFVELSLLWFIFHVISIDNIPLLVQSSVFVPDNDVSVLLIFVSMDIHNLSFLVDEVIALVSEELEPSCIGLPDLEIA